MFWQLDSFPKCEYHVFLSHCAEDRTALVYPVYEALQRNGIIAWLDREDYYYGRDSRLALRDGLLRCRHVVFFITKAMTRHQRGWCAMELAYADLLQANLVHPGGSLLNFELPLFFLDQTDSELQRTVWAALRDRGTFCPLGSIDQVEWAVSSIASFLRREQALAVDLAKVITPRKPLYRTLKSRDGLVQRVVSFDPGPIR